MYLKFRKGNSKPPWSLSNMSNRDYGLFPAELLTT